jgi:hypothetical protein
MFTQIRKRPRLWLTNADDSSQSTHGSAHTHSSAEAMVTRHSLPSIPEHPFTLVASESDDEMEHDCDSSRATHTGPWESDSITDSLPMVATETAAATAPVAAGKRTFPCRVCGRALSSASNRLRHERAKHEGHVACAGAIRGRKRSVADAFETSQTATLVAEAGESPSEISSSLESDQQGEPGLEGDSAGELTDSESYIADEPMELLRATESESEAAFASNDREPRMNISDGDAK